MCSFPDRDFAGLCPLLRLARDPTRQARSRCVKGPLCNTTKALRRTWICGRSINQLAARILADIEAGFSVSLGLEAPMWFPIYQECADQLWPSPGRLAHLSDDGIWDRFRTIQERRG